MNWEDILKDFLGSWNSRIWFWQLNGEMERKRVRVEGSVQEGMRKSDCEGDRMQGRESKSKWGRVWGRAGKCMRAGTDGESNSEGKWEQESKHMRACRRRRPCLKHSVMSAINNRYKKLSCLQWAVFWPTYYRSQTWPNTVGLGALKFSY